MFNTIALRACLAHFIACFIAAYQTHTQTPLPDEDRRRLEELVGRIVRNLRRKPPSAFRQMGVDLESIAAAALIKYLWDFDRTLFEKLRESILKEIPELNGAIVLFTGPAPQITIAPAQLRTFIHDTMQHAARHLQKRAWDAHEIAQLLHAAEDRLVHSPDRDWIALRNKLQDVLARGLILSCQEITDLLTDLRILVDPPKETPAPQPTPVMATPPRPPPKPKPVQVPDDPVARAAAEAERLRVHHVAEHARLTALYRALPEHVRTRDMVDALAALTHLIPGKARDFRVAAYPLEQKLARAAPATARA